LLFLKKLFGKTILNVKLRIFIVIAGYLLLLYLILLAIDKLILPSITSGSATILIPNIISQDINNAQKIIRAKELTLEITKEVYSEKVPPGSVVAQIPNPNSQVKKGRCVYVTLSKGKELVAVPYLKGLNLRTAKINLMKAGLELGDTKFDFHDQVGKDTIISQSQSPGSKITYGTPVNIVVSKGSEKQTKIPYLIGLSMVEASVLINESGLEIGNITYQTDRTFISDIIISQSPTSGEVAIPGAKVHLILTK